MSSMRVFERDFIQFTTGKVLTYFEISREAYSPVAIAIYSQQGDSNIYTRFIDTLELVESAVSLLTN
jgi:hypothetical protein